MKRSAQRKRTLSPERCRERNAHFSLCGSEQAHSTVQPAKLDPKCLIDTIQFRWCLLEAQAPQHDLLTGMGTGGCECVLEERCYQREIKPQERANSISFSAGFGAYYISNHSATSSPGEGTGKLRRSSAVLTPGWT